MADEQSPLIGVLYRSNQGVGKFVARVVDVNDEEVTLAYIGNVQYDKWFSLPRRYFDSPKCGWRKEPVRPAGVE